MARLAVAVLSFFFALPAFAADARKYAVLSLIGDEMLLVGAEAQTGGRLDRNPRRYLELMDSFADKAVLLAANETLKQITGTEPVLLFGRDRRLYAAQARLLDSGSSMEKLLADIRPLLANTGATHLVLVTKDRREARLQLHNTTVGHGMLQGIGYYLDREMELQMADTGASAVGFVAAFAYFNASLIRLDTGQIIAEQRVNASRPYTTPSNISAEDIWGGMPAVERVTMLRDLVGREARAAIPKLLSESR
jgi:hypothetical protein